MDTSQNLFYKLKTFIRTENTTLVFGLGFSGDVLLAIFGNIEKNIFFTYSACAAIAATGLMTIPGLLKFRLGQNGQDGLACRMKFFAGPLHHTAGLAMICSGFGWRHTGRTIFEILFGIFSTSGSISQFWGDGLLLRLQRLFGKNLPANLDGGKIASGLYLVVIPSVVAMPSGYRRLTFLLPPLFILFRSCFYR